MAFVSARHDIAAVESPCSSQPDHFTEVGFSELREASIAIASELCHRHGITQSTVPTDTLSPRGVLVVSDEPSAGEAAAVLACTRLRVPFVPVDLVGPNRVGMKRLRDLLSDCDCRTAIVVVHAKVEGLAADTRKDPDGSDDDFLTAPAMQTSGDSQLDEHAAVRLLERAGIYRHVMVSSRDGTLLNGLGISELELPEPIVDETIVSLRDPLYVLCTSGSTSSGQGQQKSGKAVLQTHGGLLNRIQWQWETFPFVQQMRRNIGFAETNVLLDADGLPPTARNDMVVRRTPLSFVDSICEIFASLLAGVPLYCPSSQLLRREGLAGILDDAEHVGATRIACLPSQLSQMLRIGKKSAPWPWMSLNVAIVSGEPCPPSLPELWETTVSPSSSPFAHKLLINLYGQTESSADILCAVISKGGAGKSSDVSRFPMASKYHILSNDGNALSGGSWWSPAKKDSQVLVDVSLARSLRWTVPCGLPILRHNIMIMPHLNDVKNTKYYMDRLLVEGPGLALGYLNRQRENENSFKDVNGERWFDTGDLAHIDDETGVVYILGRAGDAEGGQIGGKGASLVGKINGVLVHTAEVEAVMGAALSEIIKRKEKASKTSEDLSHDGLNVVAVINQAGAEQSDDSIATLSNPRRLSVFVDLSSIPARLLCQTKARGLCSTCALMPPKESFASSHLTLLEEAKALLVGSGDSGVADRSDDFVCHPALIPHRIFLVSSIPRSGAAGKVDRIELARLSSSLCNLGVGEQVEDPVGDDCSLLDLVSTTYRKILGLHSLSTTQSFSQLGGDSMMAIECAHSINEDLKKTEGSRVAHVSAMDVMELPIDEIKYLLSSGRKPIEVRVKKQRKENCANDERLQSLGGVVPSSIPRIPTGFPSNVSAMHVTWKCPLLMCVDAKPLLIDKSIVVVGSQGGDILFCNSESGEVLQRKQLSGKIEGGATAFHIDAGPNGGGNDRVRSFVFVCTYSDDGRSSGSGKVYALELCKKRKLGDDLGKAISIAWEREIDGKLKGSPALFCITEERGGTQTDEARFGILVGGYDGKLRYFDAISGENIACLDDLGGAIHATPAIFERTDGAKCALVASSTWTGTLSCIHLQHGTMTKLWHIDVWTPIYASPLIYVKEHEKQRKNCVAMFGAVDGAVRCVDLDDGTGSEVWKTSIGSSKPIFSGCILVGKGNNGDGDTRSIIVGSHDGSVSCLSIDDGSCIFRYQGIGSIVGTPAVVDDNSTARCAQLVVAGSTSGDVVCLDSKTGSVKKQLPKPVINGEIFSSVATRSSSVFFGARDSHLYKIDL